jgi:hypothetical protein
MKTSRSNVLLQEGWGECMCVYFINVGLDSTVHTQMHWAAPKCLCVCVCNGAPGTTTKNRSPRETRSILMRN